MMALFIDLCDYLEGGGMKRRLFLTNQYSLEALTRKLQVLVNEDYCDEEYLKDILKGEVLEEDYIYVAGGDVYLTTQCNGSTWLYERKDKITIHPNGTWSVEKYSPLYQAVKDFLCQKKQGSFLKNHNE